MFQPWRFSSATKQFCSWWRPSWSKRSTINLFATRSAQSTSRESLLVAWASTTSHQKLCLNYDTLHLALYRLPAIHTNPAFRIKGVAHNSTLSKIIIHFTHMELLSDEKHKQHTVQWQWTRTMHQYIGALAPAIYIYSLTCPACPYNCVQHLMLSVHATYHIQIGKNAIIISRIGDGQVRLQTLHGGAIASVTRQLTHLCSRFYVTESTHLIYVAILHCASHVFLSFRCVTSTHDMNKCIPYTHYWHKNKYQVMASGPQWPLSVYSYSNVLTV